MKIDQAETVGFHIMPAPAGTCSECATAHEPHYPHNAQSLHYQYTFYARHGRWPDWRDAMAHCPEKVRKLWTESLIELGVDVENGKVNPESK